MSILTVVTLVRGLNCIFFLRYIAGHQNSVNQMIKDNGRDAKYVPNPTVFLFLIAPFLAFAKHNPRLQLISFTGGDGFTGYTELSEVYYAKARALADAGNVLPYFAGSGLTVARRFGADLPWLRDHV